MVSANIILVVVGVLFFFAVIAGIAVEINSQGESGKSFWNDKHDYYEDEDEDEEEDEEYLYMKYMDELIDREAWYDIVDVGFSKGGYIGLILIHKGTDSYIGTIELCDYNLSHKFPRINSKDDFLNMEVRLDEDGDISEIRYKY